MAMNSAYLRALAQQGGAVLAYIGLVDDKGRELREAPYERQAASWAVAEDGSLDLAVNLSFAVAAKGVVGGWRGYSSARGGEDFGGESLPVETFNGPGQYTLLATGTSVIHEAR